MHSHLYNIVLVENNPIVARYFCVAETLYAFWRHYGFPMTPTFLVAIFERNNLLTYQSIHRYQNHLSIEKIKE